MNEFILRGRNNTISTDINGYNSIIQFYNFANKFNNCTIKLNFDAINFIDANLSSLLSAIIYYLKINNNINTYIDFSTFKGDLNILIRNGFTKQISQNSNFNPIDNRASTIPLKTFKFIDADGFCDYIEKDFLNQRGLNNIESKKKEKLLNSFIEIFSNVELHANTDKPIFVCGQFFPTQQELKFTLVDLGDGFLKKIVEYTKQDERITKASEAIDWAVKGNSTKKDAKGGTGLKSIMNYCVFNSGSLHIISDGCYWDFTNRTKNIFTTNLFTGATINLIFRFLN